MCRFPEISRGIFEPQVLKTSISQDNSGKSLSMYVKRMTTEDIEEHTQDIYGISVLDSAASWITDKILPSGLYSSVCLSNTAGTACKE